MADASGNGQQRGLDPAPLLPNAPDDSNVDIGGVGSQSRDGRDRRRPGPSPRKKEVHGDAAPGRPEASIVSDLYIKAKKKAVTPPDDDEMRVGYPNLWQLLTMDRYPDGTDRFLAEIVIKRADGGYSAEVKDHETCHAKQAFASRLLDIASALEEALLDATKPWRPFQSFLNPRGIDRHDKKKT